MVDGDRPGKIDGQPLTEANFKLKTSLGLGKLRGELTKYLDDFQAGGKTFLNPARPLAFEHLRVIAFVQDDSTREILQAVQIEVNGK